MHSTSDCRKYNKDGKPLGAAPGKPSDSGKPHKKFGGVKQLAYMTAMFESIQKGLKKQKKGCVCSIFSFCSIPEMGQDEKSL